MDDLLKDEVLIIVDTYDVSNKADLLSNFQNAFDENKPINVLGKLFYVVAREVTKHLNIAMFFRLVDASMNPEDISIHKQLKVKPEELHLIRSLNLWYVDELKPVWTDKYLRTGIYR